MKDTFPGTVVEIHGVRATVLEDGTGERLRCRPLRDRTQLAVGDRVVVERGSHGPRVASLGERHQVLWRPQERGRKVMASHVDRVVAVVSVRPEPSPGLLDRFLVAADAEDIEVLIVLNKVDLSGREAADATLAVYGGLGMEVLDLSARTGEGLEALAQRVSTGLSVFAGHSGVGKSSLLNALVPDAELRIGEVNEHTGRGRHTTSVTTCHTVGAHWPAGALIVDTPGVRSFGLYGLELSQVGHGFREFRQWTGGCRFRDCLHEEEPECGVRAALDAGECDPGRYERYRKVVDSVRRGDG